MTEQLLIGLTSIIVFGVGAQWLAWRTQLPAILLLLISGILAGPILNLINPDVMMGELLAPFISVSVAIILFEGGLSLRFSELKKAGGVIGNLVSIGVVATWIISGVSAYYFLDFGWELAVLLGAILVVTGPTVVIPLLRQVRPAGQVSSILKWEGIIIDPIGAMLAVLVFEVILTSGFSEATNLAVLSIVKTIFFGTVVGLAGAASIYFLLKRHLLPDFLQNPVNLMIVISAFTISNLLQHESGLWAATLMGITLANQKTARIQHIVEFKESLRVLLLSALFILLAARVELSDLLINLNWDVMAFIGILIFVARPISVYLSTLRSDLNWREKLFLVWMAPRGVVAASISSIFAISLVQNGYPDAGRIIPIVLIIIISTVAIYGLSASWVAGKLGVAKPIPNGVLILGAHDWGIKIAKAIQSENRRVLVADNNWKNVFNARSENIDAYHGNILSEYALDEINLDGIGRLFSLTPNDEVNALAALRLSEIFGRSNVYQLPSSGKSSTTKKEVSEHLTGRILFDDDLTFEKLSSLTKKGAELHTVELSQEYNYKKFKEESKGKRIPMFLITSNQEVHPFTVPSPPSPAMGDTLVYMEISNVPESINDITV